jgi:peptidoglycan/LPS O-acetylase OafA/YrhL
MDFSLKHTNQLKGIAIVLLLFHHSFLNAAFPYAEWYVNGVECVKLIAKLSKLCVGIFVFLSGYGLYKSQKRKQRGLKSFYASHFSKIYLTYGLIWILFVPITFIFFGISLSDVYVDKIPEKLIVNVLGLQNMFGFWGINPTWWFITCILLLYFLFPFLKVLLDKFNLIFVLIVLIFSLFTINISFNGIQPYEPIREYIFTFVLGMFFGKNEYFEKIKQNKPNKWIKISFSTILILALLYVRNLLNTKAIILTDGIITIFLGIIIFELNTTFRFLEFLGKHSFNIFLFHTFIQVYFLPKFIYSFYYPILIWLIMIALCVALSILIDDIKKILQFDKVQSRFDHINFKKNIAF